MDGYGTREVPIEQIAYEPDYKLDILLGNGHRIIYNMKPHIVTARFRDLAEWTVFCTGEIADSRKVIRWNDTTELSVSEIMLNVKHVRS